MVHPVVFPGDLLYRRFDEESFVWPAPEPSFDPLRSSAESESLAAAIRLLASAQRPIVVSGSGVIWSQASEALRRFVDLTGIPFYTTPQGRGVIPEDHHLCYLNARSRAFREADVVLVVDGQEILNYGRQSIPSFRPGHRINAGTFGTMGVGLPYALGAKVARPDCEVVCLHGDGSLGMNFMELDTAVRHGIPVITVVSLNGGWTADPQKTKPGRELGLTRYHAMAEALGCDAWYVERAADIRPALLEARASSRRGVPALVNVRTDPDAQASTAKFTTFYDAA